jgi:hypothetical protein
MSTGKANRPPSIPCKWCDRPVKVKPLGRLPSYCSRYHQQLAHQARTAHARHGADQPAGCPHTQARRVGALATDICTTWTTDSHDLPARVPSDGTQLTVAVGTCAVCRLLLYRLEFTEPDGRWHTHWADIALPKPR